jgi:hypothetical protein
LIMCAKMIVGRLQQHLGEVDEISDMVGPIYIFSHGTFLHYLTTPCAHQHFYSCYYLFIWSL